jgi:outer membrane protein insertion porin family
VDYVAAEGTKTDVDISKIEDTLRERDVHVALDTFVDEATIRRVKGVIREIYSDKGHNDVRIDTALKALPAGPKLVHLTFTIDQGPKYKIDDVVFDGNSAFSDATLRSQMKDNKPKAWWSFFTSGGTYLDAKFADDADKVNEFYLDKGYVRAIIGQPQIETVRDSSDGKTRWIRLRVPVDEGLRYRIGTFTIADNTALRTDALRAMFKVEEGDFYNYGKIKKGLEKAQEIYGQLGFWQWAPDPQALPRGVDPNTGMPTGPEEPPPIVDVTIRMIEGKRYYVNRITLTGNTTTHDSVARREMRVYEGGVFDTQALKESIRRLNQLGYFKPLEGTPGEIDVQPTPGRDGLVDIKLKFEEQNRNQISFGAGISQFDGFFGQLSYQTSNFLGRGETFGVNLQKGSRARQYQVSFSEPYLFDRPITAGIEVSARQFVFPFQFTQDSTGGNIVVGFPISRNWRLFTSYGYERIRVFDINEIYLSAAALVSNPFLRESLLIDSGGERTVSKITPSIMYNTVNQPIFPNDGKRLTAAVDVAGLGGSTEFIRTRLEGIWYIPLGGPTGRFSLGLRAEGTWIRPHGATTNLPIFEKFFLGGEYSVRGFDMRTIGPRDPITGVVTGGNKTLTFNGEFYINIAGPVRLLAFYDAGQVRDIGESFVWSEQITEIVQPPLPLLYDPFTALRLTEQPFVETTRVIGRTPAFKTSTGLELRFFMPVLNVPFRLIASYNPSRRGVFNNNLEPTKRFTFRFAVGTTF